MRMYLLILSVVVPLLSFGQQNNPCDKIEYINDDVRDFKLYHTPYNTEASSSIWISKIIRPNKKPEYYISIRVNEPEGKTVNGVFIVLDSGKKISRPNAEITLEVDKEDVDIIHQGFIQSFTFQITPQEITLLKSSSISKYAISYLNETPYQSDELYKMFLCLLNK